MEVPVMYSCDCPAFLIQFPALLICCYLTQTINFTMLFLCHLAISATGSHWHVILGNGR